MIKRLKLSWSQLQDNMVEALKKGASDFIQKPFESDVILEVVQKVLEE